jgi:diacylglycerol O-acyltransferase
MHAFSLARVKAVARASESTLNDVVLAISAGALRRYLEEIKALPPRALTAGVPVGLKHGEGAFSGNRVSLLFATLATDVRDPFKRLMAIRESTQAAKQHLQAMSVPSVDLYSTVMMIPVFVGSVTGNAMSNVAVSNVAGPHVRLFLAGAPLEATCPISVLTPNMALNITCLSYHKGLYLGLTACPDLAPHVEHLAAHMGDAFNELEAAVKRHAASHSAVARQSRPMKRARLRRPAPAS